MSTNINDFVRPTSKTDRRDINKILEMIHDIVASEPEDEGQKERICKTEHVKNRTTAVTFGGANLIDTDIKGVIAQVIRRELPTIVNSYSKIHTTTGTLTFPGKNTKFGASGKFDGTQQIGITPETDFDFEHTQAFSIAFWAKNTMTSTGFIISKQLNNTSVGFSVRQRAGDTLFIIYDSLGNVFNVVTTSDTSDDSWHHIVCTFSGNSNQNGMKIYVDNILQATGATLAISNTIVNNEPFIIGARTSAGALRYIGEMALLSLIKSEVNSTWVTNHFNNLLDTSGTNTEIVTINFVGNELPTPDETSSFCKSS